MADKEELEALRNRVKIGNGKLFKAWQQIMEISDKEEQVFQEDKWEKARDKLHYLCLELQGRGYEDCLYIEDGKKVRRCPESIECLVCPSKIPYWREENAGRGSSEYTYAPATGGFAKLSRHTEG